MIPSKTARRLFYFWWWWGVESRPIDRGGGSLQKGPFMPQNGVILVRPIIV